MYSVLHSHGDPVGMVYGTAIVNRFPKNIIPAFALLRAPAILGVREPLFFVSFVVRLIDLKC
jgi:hypothetical protein